MKSGPAKLSSRTVDSSVWYEVIYGTCEGCRIPSEYLLVLRDGSGKAICLKCYKQAMTPPDKQETPRTDAAKYIGRQSVPSHLAEDLEREAAALKRELTQWREVAGRLAEGLDAVLAHRGVDHEGNHSMWVGETAFLICKDCLTAYDALAKLSEKP